MLPYTRRAMSKTPLCIRAGIASSTPACGTRWPGEKTGAASSRSPRYAISGPDLGLERDPHPARELDGHSRSQVDPRAPCAEPLGDVLVPGADRRTVAPVRREEDPQEHPVLVQPRERLEAQAQLARPLRDRAHRVFKLQERLVDDPVPRVAQNAVRGTRGSGRAAQRGDRRAPQVPGHGLDHAGRTRLPSGDAAQPLENLPDHAVLGDVERGEDPVHRPGSSAGSRPQQSRAQG